MIQASNKRGPFAAAAVIVILVLLPIVYFLSIGPAIWIHENGNLSPSSKEAIEAFYIPLIGLAELFDPFEDALEWYADLWD